MRAKGALLTPYFGKITLRHGTPLITKMGIRSIFRLVSDWTNRKPTKSNPTNLYLNLNISPLIHLKITTYLPAPPSSSPFHPSENSDDSGRALISFQFGHLALHCTQRNAKCKAMFAVGRKKCETKNGVTVERTGMVASFSANGEEMQADRSKYWAVGENEILQFTVKVTELHFVVSF